MLSVQNALIHTMMLVSAADNNITDPELRTIGLIVRTLPVFQGFEPSRLPDVAADCAALLDQDDGLDTALALIREALPAPLRETAYALAVEVAAADLTAAPEELRVLEMIRHRLDLDRLIVAGIERGARARYTRLPAA
jgi:tellurite resistance protein